MKYKRLILLLLVAGLFVIPVCEPDKKMLVETGEASNISTTTADVSGTVIDVGEGATQHGHSYGTAAGPTVSGSKTALGVAAAGDFTSSLTGLQPSTKYYVRAYTSLGAEAAYGSEITFTTASAALPELTTTAITSITKTSAVSGGNISSEGGTPVTTRGVCWNVASGPTIANSKTTDGSGSGTFASSITGLSSNTVYYVRAYATNSGGTAYGNEISFTTSPEVAVAPAVTTSAVTSITSNSAVSGGDVTNEGGAPVTAKGVCWSTTANPTITSSKTTDGTGSGSFVSNLTNLNPGTTYYVRAYATNSAGTSYGNEFSFATTVVIPTLTTITVTSITSTTAVSGGDITSTGGASITVRGVCWGTSTNPTTELTTKTSDGTGTGTYTSNLTGLTGNTTYYVRAYATNSAGTAYGDEKSFKTGAIVPTLTTAAVTSITSTTATSGGDISSDGGSSVTARGVCWSTSANPTTSDTKTSDGTGTGTFTSSITGLAPGTTYHVRAYATNSKGTAYGNDISFTAGTVIPTVTTSAITNITSTTATSGGTVTSDGGTAVTVRGVCWGTTANPTTSDSKTSDGTGLGSFISSLTGLTASTTYHVRAYATNNTGTGYGNDLTFATSTVPGAPAIGTATAGNAQATVTFTAPASDGGSAITGYTVTSNPGSITGTGTASPVTVTGLTNGTAYTFTVTATNANGTGPASSASNSVTPSTVPGAPTIGTATKGNAQATVTFTAPVSDGGSAITGYTVTSNPDGKTAAGTSSPITVTGLTNGTAYTFTVTATNVNGTGTASAASNSVTPSTALTVPDAPTGVSAVPGYEKATVTFTAPINDGGSAITGYTVTSSPGGFVGTGSASPISVTGLPALIAYTFTVTATNAIGTGPASSASNSVTPTTVPGAPTIGTATKGDAQATVTFTAPVSDGGSAITGYTVTSSPGGFIGTGSASPITVTGLPALIAYTFTVTATNANGTGAASAASNSVTPSTVPGAPTIGTATAGNAQATVTFTASANDGGSAITGYTVTSNPGSITGTGTASPITVTGLTNGTAYTFTVTATNANGPGPASSASNSVTPSTVPGAPTIGTATAGDTQATVTFTAPASDGGSTITGYTATSNPGGFTGTSTTSPITVTGLTNLTAYTITVTATNANGTGPASAPSNSVIPGTVYSSGKIWMDRNLGATQVATSSTDAASYGDLYQWGRLADGHQVRTSGTTSTLSGSDSPGHDDFITVSLSPTDWRSPQNNNLWQGVSGVNNPCPAGYRLPTDAEWEAERLSWSTNNAAGAFASPLKLPLAGYRDTSNGSLGNVGASGHYWGGTVSSSDSRLLYFHSSSASINNGTRAHGFSVRCLKD